VEHSWSVLCRHFIRSADTNNFSLVEVIEALTFTPEDPISENEVEGIPLEATIVSLWWRSVHDQPENARTRTLLISPDGELLDEMQEIELDLTDVPRIRSILQLRGMPYAGSGTYKFVVQLAEEESDSGWRDVATLPLPVTFSPNE
jgi:hypothetical protein